MIEPDLLKNIVSMLLEQEQRLRVVEGKGTGSFEAVELLEKRSTEMYNQIRTAYQFVCDDNMAIPAGEMCASIIKNYNEVCKERDRLALKVLQLLNDIGFKAP